ncbi:hypothetical protein COLO4_17926 [Corchorus olitorius]|uniref:Uncharacterized protein n=1 Tax=Corchorus olitorius TaxID=93759 RepID=A0A1R3JB26_9ROSI|nr:hypothetical protein COLO4_17926 [Corchorus olitorius]
MALCYMTPTEYISKGGRKGCDQEENNHCYHLRKEENNQQGIVD